MVSGPALIGAAHFSVPSSCISPTPSVCQPALGVHQASLPSASRRVTFSMKITEVATVPDSSHTEVAKKAGL